MNVVSLFVNKNLKYSFSKCVLIYGKRVKDSKGNSIAKAGDKGAKSGKVCPNIENSFGIFVLNSDKSSLKLKLWLKHKKLSRDE